MNPPQAFYDFTMQFHQDLHLTHPLWASDSATARHDIYAGFRQRYGDQAVRDLRVFSRQLLSDSQVELEVFWFNESKADWVMSEKRIRRLFADFENWATSS